MTAPAVDGVPEADTDQETPKLEDQQVGGDLIPLPVLTPTMKATLVALYGSDFPLAKDIPPTRADWAGWANGLWARHQGGVQPRLYLAERNRSFRKGVQWIAPSNGGPWRTPIAPRDQVRAVENVIAPALDMRVQIITEQRPGFRTKPAKSDAPAMKKAEAQQAALEYQYDSQNMAEVQREAAYWAGTDGCSFLETYWDPYAGPWDELPVNPDDPQSQTISQPMGDLRTRVRRIEQVRVSAEATANLKPHYVVIRELIPAAHAAGLYGSDVLDTAETGSDSSQANIQQSGMFRNGYELPAQDQLYRDQATVERTTVYVEPCEYLPKGVTIVALGSNAPYVGPLLSGCVPVVRYTDGSTDPSYFPTPIMDGWVDSQMRINKIKSQWIEAARGGAKIMARDGTLVQETLQAGSTTVLTVRDPRPFDDLVKIFPAVPFSNESKELMAMERKQFEDLSGWNAVSRGEFASDTSGRAILAIREQLERIFAPPVHAASQAMTEWGKVQLLFMRWGYTMPRMLSVQGQSRPDLARSISSADFDGVAEVFIDPETLMPMPRSLRLFLLNDMAQRGLISPQEYRRRLPFAWVKNMATPDDDQEARARRCAEAIRQSGNPMALPVLWQDNEAIHQDILERELILPDETPPPVREAAQQRWQQLAQQAKSKQGPPPPQPGTVDFIVQQFMSGIQAKIQTVIQTELSKVVEAQMGILPPPTVPVGQSGGPQGNKPPGEQPAPALKQQHVGQTAKSTAGPTSQDSTIERQFDQYSGR